MTGSGGVAQTGYGHPACARRSSRPSTASPPRCSAATRTAPATALAEQLCALLPGDFPKKAWFGTSGSDANDCIARLLPLATDAGACVVRRRLPRHDQRLGSALRPPGAGVGDRRRQRHEGAVPRSVPVPARAVQPRGLPLKCLEHVERYALGAISPAADTAAIIVEAVQSDGGEVVPPANFLPALRELCDRHGIWLVFDEVKIGLGRTGKMFAFQHSGVEADAVTLGKPLGGGLPLSAVVGRRALLDVETFSLFTLGGAPMPIAGGLATLAVIEAEGLVANAAAMGSRLLDGPRGDRRPLGADRRRARQRPDPRRRAGARPRDPRARAGGRAPSRLPPVRARRARDLLRPARQRHRADPAADHRRRGDRRVLGVFERALTDVEAGRFDDEKLAPYAGW